MSDPGDNFPSVGLDPADTDSLGGTFRFIFRKLMMSTDGMLPAQVVAVTADRNFVTVQPLIRFVGTGGDQMDRAQIANVPVFTMGAGSYVLSFPIAAGDLGWIMANDRDISLYVQNNLPTAPNTKRIKAFEDAVFFPDEARKWTLAGEDTQRTVLQNAAGTIKIAVGADMIKIVHPTKLEVSTPLAHFTTDVTIDGKLTTTGLTSLGGGAQFLKRADGSNATNVKGT